MNIHSLQSYYPSSELTRIYKLEENIGKNWLFELPVKSWKEIGNSHVNCKSYISALKDYFILLAKSN